jgi:hypothetical protein
MARGKGSTSSNKKKATARGRAAEKSASGGRTPTSVKKMSQGRFPGERPLTGEDRPADRAGGKVSSGPSAKPRGGRRGARDTSRKGDGRPDTAMGKPTPGGHHNAKLHNGRR